MCERDETRAKATNDAKRKSDTHKRCKKWVAKLWFEGCVQANPPTGCAANVFCYVCDALQSEGVEIGGDSVVLDYMKFMMREQVRCETNKITLKNGTKAIHSELKNALTVSIFSRTFTSNFRR